MLAKKPHVYYCAVSFTFVVCLALKDFNLLYFGCQNTIVDIEIQTKNRNNLGRIKCATFTTIVYVAELT